MPSDVGALYRAAHASLHHPQTGLFLGCGWIVDERRLITCAHVLGAELRDDSPASFIVRLSYRDDVEIRATRVRCSYSDPRRFDTALLQLDSPAIHLTRVGIDDPTLDAECGSLGFPNGWNVIGNWAECVVQASMPNGWFQIVARDALGFEIRGGFSGSPVWDKLRQSVVGIVVGNDTSLSRRAAFLIPVSKIERDLSVEGLARLPVFDESTVTNAAHISADPHREELARFLGSAVRNLDDPVQRYWVYQALGVIDNKISLYVLKNARQTERDEFALSALR